MTEEYLTVRDVAERLHVAERTVREWLREGRLKGKHLGGRAGWRIRVQDVSEFFDGLDGQEPKTTA